MNKKEESIRKQIRKLLDENSSVVIDEVLQGFKFPKEVNVDESYFLREDDCDGYDSGIQIMFSGAGIRFGDAFVVPEKTNILLLKNMSSSGYGFCFRTPWGGSASPKMNAALVVLAYAIATSAKPYAFNVETQEKVEKK